MFHLRFGLSDHLKALLDFVFGSRRRVKKVRIFRAWFSHGSGLFSPCVGVLERGCAVLALLFLVGVLFSPLSFLVGRKETRRRHEIPTQLLEVCLTSMMLESSLRCAMTAIG